jgi:hypothetical protein
MHVQLTLCTVLILQTSFNFVCVCCLCGNFFNNDMFCHCNSTWIGVKNNFFFYCGSCKRDVFVHYKNFRVSRPHKFRATYFLLQISTDRSKSKDHLCNLYCIVSISAERFKSTIENICNCTYT